MNIETHLTATEACTLIAHEAVSMLDAVQKEIPQSRGADVVQLGVEPFGQFGPIGPQGGQEQIVQGNALGRR